MIIDQKVQIKPTNKNKRYYLDLGYEFQNGETIHVDVKELPKRSTALVKFKCDECEKVFEKPLRETGQSDIHFCSKKCNDSYKAKEARKSFESLIGGMDAKDFLYQKYVVEKLSFRKIAKEIYGRETEATTVKGWIVRLGLNNEIRHGSEAIKTQWINNEDRKELSRKIAKNHLHTKESRNKMIAKMRSTKYRLKFSIERQGKNNPMYGVVGKNHPNWNPSLTDDERKKNRKIVDYERWRLMVFERDKYTCQCCGDNKGGNLVAHHLNGYHWDKDNRFNVDNGITLCEDCHIAFHNKYGYKFNTKEQYEEFKALK